jgi:hypothetical protein
MIEIDKLREAPDFITRELQKQGVDLIDTIDWQQTPQDRATKIHRLVLIRGGEKSIFTFTEYELLENHGSKQWEKQLRDHVSDMLMEF